ncbi:MAG: hypothetical protein J1D88_03945 [Treponema sp.]|nr:hypothetical protein [Treponema sp.]
MRSSSLSDESGTHKRTPAFQKIMFAVKLLLGALPLVGFYCYARFFPQNYMPSSPFLISQKFSYLKDDVSDFTVIGDSVANDGIDENALTTDTVITHNISFSGYSSIECYYSLKTYLKMHKTKNVMLMLYPKHYETVDQFFNYAAYGHLFSFGDYLEIYNLAKKNNANIVFSPVRDGIKTVNFTFNDYWNPVFHYLAYSPQKYLPAMNNAKFFKRKQSNEEELARLSHRADFFPTSSNPTFTNFIGNEFFEPKKLHTVYLEKICEITQENNIRLIILICPFSEMSKERIKQKAEKDYFSYLQSIRDKYSHVYLDSEQFIYYDDKYFKDFAHFNKSGAEKYTQYIKQTYIDPYIHNKTTAEVIK